LQDPKNRKKIRHLGTIAQLCRAISSQRRHVSTIGEKNLLNSNISPHFFGPLVAEIHSGVWGTPANFSAFCVLAALLHSTLAVGVSQALRHLTESATYIRQGGHHVGIGPYSSVFWLFPCLFFFVVDLVSSVLNQEIG